MSIYDYTILHSHKTQHKTNPNNTLQQRKHLLKKKHIGKTDMKTVTLIIVGLIFIFAAIIATCEKIIIRRYSIKTEKLFNPIKILHISDHHSSKYGKKQHKLLLETEKLNPDVIMMTGDIVDNRLPTDESYHLVKELAKKYRCYYVIGNHEVYTLKAEQIKKDFRSFGVTVLEGNKSKLSIADNIVTVCGIDDPYAFPDKKGRFWEEQLLECSKYADKNYSILLSHRCEPVDFYRNTRFDLILSGHAHGGQIIVPWLINGLYAPHQGWFPKYAGGRYDFNNQVLIVSRGLSKYIWPRIFNRPEIGLIEISPN